MASVNKVIIIGNLGRDPEVRYNPNGGAWCTVTDASRFFSYRRDGVTGRMAAAIWIQGR